MAKRNLAKCDVVSQAVNYGAVLVVDVDNRASRLVKGSTRKDKEAGALE